MGSESLAFKEWLRSENLVYSTNIADFKGATIAIDADDYITTLLWNPATKEALLPALGGLPFALERNVASDLNEFRSAGIKPIFVFNGLDLACRDRKSINSDAQRASTIIGEAWKLYEGGKGDEAVQTFGKACTYRTSHVVRHLLFYLHRQDIPVFRAPYNAAAQALQLVRDDIAHAVCGSASSLVFGAEKVILNFNFDNKNVTWVQPQHVFQRLMLNRDQVVDLCLLSGSSILPALPEIDTEAAGNKVAAARAVMSRANQDGHTACLQAKDEAYLASFRKAKMCVKHMIVMIIGGDVKQFNLESSPSDLHDAVGQRLPDELLTYFSRGMVSNRVLNWRTRQEIFETPPLDGGSTQAYRNLIQEKLRPLHTRSIAILTRSLHRYFQRKDVDLVCWFNENDKRPLGVLDLPLPDITRDAETWHVSDSLMAQSTEGKELDINQSPIQYAIAVLSDENLAKKTVTKRKEGTHSVLKTPTELLANTTWRFLQDRGYINNDHTLSAWGKALKAAFHQATNAKNLNSTDPTGEIEEAIFIAFELFRLDVLNNKQLFNPVLSGAPWRGTEVDKGNTMLLSRIACLGSFSHEEIGYTGPLSKHLLAYHQLVAAVRNSLRDLIEMHAANLMLSASAVRLRVLTEYTDLGARLPFDRERDLGLAILVKCELDEPLSEVKRASMKEWFRYAKDIDGDLLKAWDMWDAINTGIQAADSGIVSSETKDSWRNTDTWLHKKLQAAATTNGVWQASGEEDDVGDERPLVLLSSNAVDRENVVDLAQRMARASI